MIENRKDLIAKAFCRDGVLSFWKFVLDTGQDLEYGDFRIPACRLVNIDILKQILKEEKKRLCACESKKAQAYRISRAEKVYQCATRKKSVFIVGM